jgi:hypothetical protein
MPKVSLRSLRPNGQVFRIAKVAKRQSVGQARMCNLDLHEGAMIGSARSRAQDFLSVLSRLTKRNASRLQEGLSARYDDWSDCGALLRTANNHSSDADCA